MVSLRKRIDSDIKEFYKKDENKFENYVLVVGSDKKADNYWNQFTSVRKKVCLLTLDEFFSYQLADVREVKRLAYDMNNTSKGMVEEFLSALESILSSEGINFTVYNQEYEEKT